TRNFKTAGARLSSASCKRNSRGRAQHPAAGGGGPPTKNKVFFGIGRGGGSLGLAGELPAPSQGFPGTPCNTKETNLQLEKYLPRHGLDPNRKIAGVGSMHPDINTRGTDIFQRISDRFVLICSLDRLKDCEIGHNTQSSVLTEINKSSAADAKKVVA